MEDSEEEYEFLNLSLSVNAVGSREKKNKGKMKRQHDMQNNALPTISISPHHQLGYEPKILMLLQTRDQMLRQEQHDPHSILITKPPGLPLIHLLLTTATAVDDRNNLSAALDSLTDLYRSVSLTGDSVQRVVAYFADALAAKVLTKKSPFYGMVMEEPSAEEHFVAFTDLYRVSPYYQFAHFSANQAFLEAFEDEQETNGGAIHVVDFDVSYGFQWPSLIQSLSEKGAPGHRISLRITGFGDCLKQLRETEARLVSFSSAFSNNLLFEFQGLLRGSRAVTCLRKRKNETVAVNLASSVPHALGFVRSLEPSVVVVVKREGSRSGRSFLSRFTESLHYFAAMFDSLDDCLPLESAERLRIEKTLLGSEIKGALNCCHVDDGGDKWEGSGFGGKRLSDKCVMQAKLLLKMRTHHCPLLQFHGEGFRVCESDDGTAISLGWQNRFLLTVSAWQPQPL